MMDQFKKATISFLKRFSLVTLVLLLLVLHLMVRSKTAELEQKRSITSQWTDILTEDIMYQTKSIYSAVFPNQESAP